MSTPTQRPTPMTDQIEASLAKSSNVRRYYATLAQMRLMEVERDEAREELEAMREAIREVYLVLDNALFVHQAITTYAPQDAVDKIENQKHCDNMKTALAKLQPFIK